MATVYVTYSGGPSGSYTTDGTNDQTEINNALAYAHANPGTTVCLRGSHTYNISDQIFCGSHTIWTAETGAILKVPDNACGTDTTDCVFPDGTPVITQIAGVTITGIEIYGFEIDGNCQNQSTVLGEVGGVERSSGSGVERLIGFYGSSGSNVTDINVHNMKFHDSFGECLYVVYGQNVRFHDNQCSNHQHDAVYVKALTGSGNEIYNNIIEGITDGCIRVDSSQNVKIHDNNLSPYLGSNNNGAYEHGELGIQVGGVSSYSTLVNNIEIYNNTFTNIGLCGIWLDDHQTTSPTTARTISIHHNSFSGCAAKDDSGSQGRGAAITIGPWGKGVTIEYNTIDGTYENGILILSALSGSSPTVNIRYNNITNTHGHGTGSNSTRTTVGYAIINAVPSNFTANITGNYFSGNLTGIVYPTSLSHTSDATTTVSSAGTSSTTTIQGFYVTQDSSNTGSNYFYYNPANTNADTIITNAITAAAAVATSSNPAYVFIKGSASPYLIGGHILMRSYVNVIGDGYSTTTIKMRSGIAESTLSSDYPPGWGIDNGVSKAGAMFMCMSVTGCRISGLTFDASWDDYYSSVISRGAGTVTEITVYNSTNILIDSSKFIQGSNDGVLVGSSTNVEVAACEFNMIGHDGVAYYTCTTGKVHHSRFANRTNSAIRFYNSTSCEGYCNEIWTGSGGGSGFELQYSITGALIHHNYFHDIAGASPGYGAVGYRGQTVTGTGVKVYQNVMISCTYSTNDMPDNYELTNNLIVSAPILATNYSVATGNVTSTTGLTKNGTDQAGNVYYSGGAVIYGIDPAVALSLPQISGSSTSSGGNSGTVTPGGDNSLVPGRYIPRTHYTQEDWIFAGYYEEGRTAYINGVPLRWQSYETDTSQAISQEHPPGMDGWVIGDFGEEGCVINIDSFEYDIEDVFRILATWKARTPAIFEPGGVHTDYFLKGKYGGSSSRLKLTDRNTLPKKVYPYSVSLVCDMPYFYSKTKRIRSRKITSDSQIWNSDDTFAGNLLKNGSFENWSQTVTANGFTLLESGGDTLVSSDPYTLVSADNYLFPENVAPDNWTLVSAGQSRETVDDHFRYMITGDGATADIGCITQAITVTNGTTYVLSAEGYTESLTQGNLAVEVYADGAMVAYLLWDYTDTTPTIQTVYLSFDVTPSSVYVQIHGTGTPTNAGLLHLDNLVFEKYADFELGSSGSGIVTYGNIDVVPDIIVKSIYMSSGSTVVGSQQTSSSPTGTYYTSAATVYSSTSASLEYTITLPALAAGNVYRLDNISALLSSRGATAYLRVTAQSTGLNNNTETTLKEWTTTSSTAVTESLNINVQTTTNASVILRFYQKTSNASYRSVGTKFTVKYSTISSVAVSGGVSIYNTADPTIVMRICNQLPPLSSIGINADYTGFYEISDDFSDSSYVQYCSSHSGDSRSGGILSLTGSLVLTIDSLCPVTGIPYMKMNVVAGMAKISISSNNTTWYEIDGNTTSDATDTEIDRELDNAANLPLKGYTKFYIKIERATTTTLQISSLFLHADLNTMDLERVKIYATGETNTFCALLDASANLLVTLAYRDLQPVI